MCTRQTSFRLTNLIRKFVLLLVGAPLRMKLNTASICWRAAYGKERTIVSRRGKDLAAVIPIEDLRLLERLAQEEMDRIDLEDARAALKKAEEKGSIPLRDLMRELGD